VNSLNEIIVIFFNVFLFNEHRKELALTYSRPQSKISERIITQIEALWDKTDCALRK
jgi:hypothetical protein